MFGACVFLPYPDAMTEQELRDHRRAKDAEAQEATEAALDAAVGQLSVGEAIELVSRTTGQGGNDREARRRNIRLAVALRLTGATQKEIADEMGLSIETVRRLLQEGDQLNGRRVVQLLETRALPQAVDNLIAGLEAGNEKYTLETLKGGGILKQHQAPGSGGFSPTTNVAVVFAAPPETRQALPAGAAYGTPLTVDADKVE